MEKYPELYEPGKCINGVTAKQKRALDLYMAYNTTSQIASTLEASFSTVRDWVYIGRNHMRPFKDIRGELEKTMLKDIVSNRMPALKSIMDSSLCIVKDNLEIIKKSRTELSIDEIKKVSDIAANLDKIVRLDEGQATDNIAVSKATPIRTAKQIQEVIAEVDTLGLFEVEVIDGSK